MKKTYLAGLIGTLAFGFVISQAPAWAEIFQGEIASLNKGAKSFNLRQTDPGTGKSQELKISVPSGTQMEGVNSINELKTGDRVLVDASKGKDPKNLQATSIQVLEAETMPAQQPPAAEKQPKLVG